MRVRNWKQKLAAAFIAAGIWVGSSYTHAQMINHVIGDASFDDTDVNASTYTDYAYIDSGHVTPWEDIGTTGDGFGMWFYNANYDSDRRPTPRTGNQALHGSSDYIWQDLGDTFESGRTYTLSMYANGDSDASADPVNASDRVWVYIYDASARPDLTDTFFDPDSLVSAWFDRDGGFDLFNGTGQATNEGWTNDGGSDWGEISVSYQATADTDGRPIGVAMFGRADAAFDDVTLTSVPEPSLAILCGVGLAGLTLLRRRH